MLVSWPELDKRLAARVPAKLPMIPPAMNTPASTGQKIERSSLLPGVLVDLSALVTLTTLQLKGWAVVTD